MKRGNRPVPVEFLLGVLGDFFKYQATRTAAQISYYLLFSLFPLVMIVIGTVGFLHLDARAVIESIESVVPMTDLLEGYVSYVVSNETPALMVAGIAMAVTTSSAAFRGLMSVTGEITGHPSFRGVAFFAVSLVMSLVLLLTIFGFLLATVTGRWFLRLLSRRFHLDALVLAWQWLRFPVVFALGVLALTAVYRVCLNKRAIPSLRAWPGAVFASVALVIGTAVFSSFISISSNYSLVYGSLASIIILLLWFFVCGNILVLGNLVNYHLARPEDREAAVVLTVR